MGGNLLQEITLLSMSIASIAIGLVGFTIYVNNRKSVTHQTFLIFALCAIGWSIFNYLTFQGTTEFLALWFLRSQVFFAVLYSFFLFRLFYVFPSDNANFSKFYRAFVVPLAVGAALLTLTPFVFTRILEFSSDGRIVKVANGPALPIFGSVAIMLIIGGTTILFRKMKKATGVEKIQLRYVLIGTSVTFLLHIIFNLILPAVFNNKTFAPLGAVFIAPFVIFTTYAIVKHQFLNVKVIVAEMAVAALAIVNLVQLFSAQNLGELLFRTVIFGLVAVFGYLLVRSVQNEVRRREEIEILAGEKTAALGEVEQRNKNLATLQKISDIVLNEIEMRPMIQKILDEVPKQLETSRGAAVALVKEGQLQAYAFSASEFSQKVSSLVGHDWDRKVDPIKRDHNLLHNALLDRTVQESSELDSFISPPLPKTVATLLQKILGVRYCVAMPLFVGETNLGVMLFVFRVRKEELHARDIEMAQAIANDMTLAIERSEAIQKLKDANVYLAQLDKMKDEFISVASHELNTPLAAIEGYLSMILDEGMGKVDAKSRMYLTRAYDSSKRLAELILDLLNTSRIEQGRLKMRFSECNLAELAQSVIHELQVKSDAKKIYLKLDAPKKLPILWCDPDRIREVIVNLTGNAIKFTEKGGVTVKIEQPDHTIRVSIIDTGRGIGTEDQKKLFQKFSQVNRQADEHQGTGLGLYISKNFVDLHKGRLWVESEAGKGATFAFELPLLKEAPKIVEGAILEQSVGDPKIELGNKDAPEIVTESSKQV